MYSDLYLKSKVKPSLILITTAILGVTLFAVTLIQLKPTTSIRASKIILKRHEVVNRLAQQASIYWQTDAAETGWVVYGDAPENLVNTALDDRDLEMKRNKVKNHFVTLQNLTSGKTYYYKIISPSGLISQNTGAPFSFKTVKNPISSSVKPAYGKVLLSNGSPSENTLVFLKYKSGYPLATITKVTGEWLIPLQYVVDQKTGELVGFNQKDALAIEIFNDEAMSKIDALLSRVNPLPQSVVLGKDYNFSEQNDVLAATTSSSFYTRDQVEIYLPKEGAIIPGTMPLVKGSSFPGIPMKLEINSLPIFSTTVTPDQKGEWKLTNPLFLGPGKYVLTIRVIDSSKKEIVKKRNFSIAKSGEQVLGDATESANLVTPTIVPTEAPTVALTTPTKVATTASILTPTTPVTGISNYTFLMGSIAFLIIGAAVMIIF
ncbi:hypothetical protein HGB07_00410 [Candidatus Roizmanbacteria bacterium]|nr:hypothetical protein [Candidatus Roizmanbacteria bacterium]